MREETEGLEYSYTISHHTPLFGYNYIIYSLYLVAPLLAHSLHEVLILITIERTGAIYQHSASPERKKCILHDLPLTLGTHPNVGLTPLLTSLIQFAEHTLARAGRINGHHIEPLLKIGQMSRVIACDNHISQAPLSGIVGQDRCTAAINLIGYNQSLLAHERSIMRTLTTRRSADIQHSQPFALSINGL